MRLAALPRRRAAALAALLLALCGAGRAGAEPASAALSDEEVERRTAFIEERLDRHRGHARIWHWSWTAVNAGAAVGLSIAGGLSDETSDRVSYFSQAALAAVGVADLYLLRPLPARDGADAIRALPAETSAERRLRLARAEELLEQSAARPGGPTDWWPHILNLVVNAGAGIGVWQAGNGTDGLITGISGAFLGEVYLLGQPSGWREDLEAYRRFTASAAAPPPGSWSLVATRGGLAVRYRF
jgi:MFS family permease